MEAYVCACMMSHEGSAGEETNTHTHLLPTSHEGSAGEGKNTHEHSLPTFHKGSAGEGTNTHTNTNFLCPTRDQLVREQTHPQTLPPYIP